MNDKAKSSRRRTAESARTAWINEYHSSRGYEPLHPLNGPPTPLRTIDELTAQFGKSVYRSIADDLAADLPMSVPELGAVAENQLRERQEVADLFVSKGRLLRQEISSAEWEGIAAEERESLQAARTSGSAQASVAFHTADGDDESISLGEIKALCKAYARITGRDDIDAGFFARNAESVLAHAAYITRCDTPEQAVGAASWKRYLRRAKGVEQGSRLAVASDIESVFVRESAAMFTTRAADPVDGAFGALDISDSVQYVVTRWSEDTEAAWNRLPDSGDGYPRVIVERLMRPRIDIGVEPFDRFDCVSTSFTYGGIYGPEIGAVEHLADMLESLNRPDGRMQLVINELVVQAEATRSFPMGTLVEYVERQWRLAELADVAEQLTINPHLADEAIVLPVNHPDQLQLFSAA